MTKTDPLLRPFHLKRLTLRNRIMSTSHAPGYVVDGNPEEQSSFNAVPVNLDGTNVTITLPADASEDLDVWVQVEEAGSQPVVRKIEIASGTGSGGVSEPLALAPGNYGVLTLVPGFRLLAGTINI